MSIFEKATKQKLRFNQLAGILTVEDVWDLPLTSRSGMSLDNLAKAINKAIKDEEEESFVVSRSKASEKLKLQFDIVKHIIEVKLEERDKRAKEQEAKARKEKIMEVLARKQDQGLEELSKEELEAELAKL